MGACWGDCSAAQVKNKSNACRSQPGWSCNALSSWARLLAPHVCMSSFALTRIPSTKDSGRLGAWGTWHRCSVLENHVILPTTSFLQSILLQPLPWPSASPQSLGKVSLSRYSTTSLPVTCDMTTFLLCSLHLISWSVSGHSSFLPVCLTLLARCGGTGGSPQLWRGDSRRKTSLLTLLTQLDLA